MAVVVVDDDDDDDDDDDEREHSGRTIAMWITTTSRFYLRVNHVSLVIIGKGF